MNNSIISLSLDLQRAVRTPAVRAEQGDCARQLQVHLADGGEPYPITPDCYALFMAEKPDGTGLCHTCTIRDSTIIYQFTPQTCACPGQFPAQLRLYGGDRRLITTMPIHLEVYAALIPSDRVTPSEAELSALDDLVTRTQELCTQVEQKLEAGAFRGEAGPQGPAGRDARPSLVARNLTLAPESWTRFIPEDPEEQALADLGYRFRARAAMAGVTGDMIPYVTLRLSDLEACGAELANQFQCCEGGILAYADRAPDTGICILTAECRKGAV